MKPLLSPYLQRMRIKAVIPYVFGDVLDLGCGATDLAQFVGMSNHYVGVDRDENLLQYNRVKFPMYEFYNKDLETNDITTSLAIRFDTICMVAVIEHIKNPQNILEQCATLLKSGGRLVITTPTPFGDNVHKICARYGVTSKEAVWV